MKSFLKNEINSDFDLIAKDLKRAREDKKLSLEEVSRRTKINKKYLIALEKGDFLSLPKGLYAKNFLKQYSVFLGLSIDNILEVYNEIDNLKREKTKNLFSNQVVKNKYFLAIPALFRNLIILGIALVFFSYLVFSFQKLNKAPNLEIKFPPNDYITKEKTLILKGLVDRDAAVLINSNNILVNLDGSFERKVNLKLGINEIIIEAKKKYGKSNLIKKQILLEE